VRQNPQSCETTDVHDFTSLQEGDGATYIIALQHGTGLQELDPPPVLPSNARFVNHPNHCFDIGTVAWVMDNHVPDPR
jgi:hypothetical protein